MMIGLPAQADLLFVEADSEFTFSGDLAYQGNVGLSYRVSDRGQAFVETGYLGSTSGTIDDVSFGSFSSWRVLLGWRQGFGGSPKTTTAAAPAPETQPDPAPQLASQPAVRGLW